MSEGALSQRRGQRGVNECDGSRRDSGIYPDLTEVGDPDGDALVENVEDHDHHEADEGGGDGRGHLGGDVLLQRLQVLQVLSSESGREGEKRSQAVDGDGHDGGQDEQNLQGVWKNQRLVTFAKALLVFRTSRSGA